LNTLSLTPKIISEETDTVVEPFSGNELVPSNWTVVPSTQEGLFDYRNSATNREETLSMEDFNALLRG
jgi:hypothetical protein